MARARRQRGPARLVVLGLLVAAAGAAWWFAGRNPVAVRGTSTPAATDVAVAGRIDAANEGRRITIEGAVRVLKPARDPQLGVAADALVLLRKVEMRQWRETCATGGCDYALVWSGQAIDSRAFKVPKGHGNPAQLPFSSERFAAAEARLGAFRVDAMSAADAAAAVPYPVREEQLPPNLAATFREHEGVLYAGNDPRNAAVGDLRVSYSIVPAGPRRLRGVQLGDRLKSSAAP